MKHRFFVALCLFLGGASVVVAKSEAEPANPHDQFIRATATLCLKQSPSPTWNGCLQFAGDRAEALVDMAQVELRACLVKFIQENPGREELLQGLEQDQVAFRAYLSSNEENVYFPTTSGHYVAGETLYQRAMLLLERNDRLRAVIRDNCDAPAR